MAIATGDSAAAAHRAPGGESGRRAVGWRSAGFAACCQRLDRAPGILQRHGAKHLEKFGSPLHLIEDDDARKPSEMHHGIGECANVVGVLKVEVLDFGRHFLG